MGADNSIDDPCRRSGAKSPCCREAGSVGFSVSVETRILLGRSCRHHRVVRQQDHNVCRCASWIGSVIRFRERQRCRIENRIIERRSKVCRRKHERRSQRRNLARRLPTVVTRTGTEKSRIEIVGCRRHRYRYRHRHRVIWIGRHAPGGR